MNFVKLIGLKRVTFLASLLGVVAFFVLGYFVVVLPMLEDSQAELAKVKSDISTLRGKISSVKADIKYMEDNIPRYKKVLDQGMFDDQDRFDVERLMEKFKKRADGVKFSYTISNIDNLKSEKATAMGYRLVSRTISLTEVRSMIDVDIYAFFQSIKSVFPLYNQIKNFKVNRQGKINFATLTEIAEGTKTNAAVGALAFDWVTLSELTEKDKVKIKSRGRRSRR